jgi:outer membrane protein TolC
VAAQSARIGIAESDFYPRFSLMGTIGVAAEHFDDLFRTPDSLFGQIGPSFRWDILNYGRILNNVRVQDARFQALAFEYQNTVLRAGREVEDFLIAFLRTQEQRDRLAASADAAARTLEITYDQYRLGAVDFTPVVLFESTLAEQQDQLVASRGNIVLNLIGTYRALGGGWEMRLARDGTHPCGPLVPVGGGPPAPGPEVLPPPAPLPARPKAPEGPAGAAPGRPAARGTGPNGL